MSNERENQREVRRIVRMLEATTKLLEKPSVLDNFGNGENRCIKQFNRALARLNDLEALPEGLFEPLTDDASIGDIGYAYHQVSTYLKDGITVDFDFKQEKETIGNIMKDVGEAVSRTIFSVKDLDSEDDDSTEPKIDTIEIVDVDDDSDPVQPRLDKLEKQMETVVEILQELPDEKGQKGWKEGGMIANALGEVLNSIQQ